MERPVREDFMVHAVGLTHEQLITLACLRAMPSMARRYGMDRQFIEMCETEVALAQAAAGMNELAYPGEE